CAFFILAVPLILCSGEAGQPGSHLSDYIPGSGEIPGWQKVYDVQEFEGEDLWEYMNGGAEIFHEYGFKQIAVQDYSFKDDKSIIVEIYEMDLPAGAYGIFSFRKSSKGSLLDGLPNAVAEEYYLNLWKGNYLVTLTGFEKDEETLHGIREFARVMEQKIDAPLIVPDLVKNLPKEGLLPLSVKYYMGYLGLFNSYAFDTEDIFGFQEAVKGGYEAGYSLIILHYSDGQSAHSMFNGLPEKINANSNYGDFLFDRELLSCRDKNNSLICMKQLEDTILIAMDVNSRNEAEEIFKTVR
ncbi:DUF6599 family protein, partial [candidate division KSB1 bacterium]